MSLYADPHIVADGYWCQMCNQYRPHYVCQYGTDHKMLAVVVRRKSIYDKIISPKTL